MRDAEEIIEKMLDYIGQQIERWQPYYYSDSQAVGRIKAYEEMVTKLRDIQAEES